MQLAITLIGPARLVDVRRSSPQVRRMAAFTTGLSAELGYVAPDTQTAPEETVVPLVPPTKVKAPRAMQKQRA
jgi:hypothetical protein